MKNGKATGHDQMPVEPIKERGKELTKFISKICEKEIIPHEWKYGIICPIHKERGRDDV
jgi:phosphorylcholine metabolism protein LicD